MSQDSDSTSPNDVPSPDEGGKHRTRKDSGLERLEARDQAGRVLMQCVVRRRKPKRKTPKNSKVVPDHDLLEAYRVATEIVRITGELQLVAKCKWEDTASESNYVQERVTQLIAQVQKGKTIAGVLSELIPTNGKPVVIRFGSEVINTPTAHEAVHSLGWNFLSILWIYSCELQEWKDVFTKAEFLKVLFPALVSFPVDWSVARQYVNCIPEIDYAAINLRLHEELDHAERIRKENNRSVSSSIQPSMPAPTDIEEHMLRVALAVGDDNAGRILAIAQRKNLSGEQKMQEILLLDSRYAGKNSNEWGTLLGVSPDVIRGYSIWKTLQKKGSSGSGVAD